MDIARLNTLKETIDAAIRADSPEEWSVLVGELAWALAEIQSDHQAPELTPSENARLLQGIKDAWYAAVEPATALPGEPAQQAALAELLSSMLATQRFTLALSRGDLSVSLDVRGVMAGSLKSLQASLRHLTWQADMIAKGDFTQKVDFMGEFSTAFNSMVSSLAIARNQIHEQNQELERVNASLREEISGRLQVEEKQRQANARAEIHRRLTEQREQERVQIARDLHDGPLQAGIALVFTLESVLGKYTDDSIREQISAVIKMTRQLVTELRQFASELRPPTLSRFGLKTTFAAYADSFRQKFPHLLLDLQFEGEDSLLPETTRIACFRIYQESLNNIARHARASRVKIMLQVDDSQVRMQIEDDGVGFVLPEDWLELARSGHLGLVGIRERAEAMGGRVEIQSQPGRGTRTCVTAPVAHLDPLSVP